MILNEERKSEDSAYWLAELRQYEEKIARLTEALERRNEEFVAAEGSLIKLIDENLSGGSHFATLVDSSRATNEREHIDTLCHLQDEIKLNRQGLQEAQKHEQLTGTVLARITSFISENDEGWGPYLSHLRMAVECFQNIWIESEKHNKKLKERLKMIVDEKDINDSLSGSRRDQLQFSYIEKKMAPLFVEVNRKTRYLLECIAVITVSLKRKRELCLMNREHLEKAHETANLQLKKYRNVLKDVGRALDSVEQALYTIRMTNNNKENSRDELQKELLILETTPNAMEYVTAIVEAAVREKTELMVLNQALEEARRISQKVLSMEKEVLESAKTQTIALEGTQHTLSKLQESLLILEKEKIELQERIEANHDMKQKHSREVEGQKKIMKEIQKEYEEIEESKRMFETEAKPFYISLNETKKQIEILRSQLESKTSRKAMLYDEKKMVEDNIKQLKSDCERSRTDIIEMHRGILTLKQQKEEASRYLKYVTSLVSDSVVSVPSMPFTHQQEMSKNHGEESLRELIIVKNRTLVEKARREQRQSLTVRGPSISSRIVPNKSYDGFVTDKYDVKYPLSSSMTQQPPHATNSLTPVVVNSVSAHYSSDVVAGESREASVFLTKEEHPSSTTSRIIRKSPEEYLFTFPSTSVIHAPNVKIGSNPLGRIEGSSMMPSSEPQISWNRDENKETSSTIASINLRLHDILNRKY
ncbi:uncharacterized protein TM35_000131900 [Trypanosoma theileri]|uniref:Uncharacterized protein n=1 Tax=Trypanosoma theileri TaxID=67003 RepID=A0A1X0NWU5_9TRYP|nr:uncharacterized protein TM35_000131900 [Trypanosoma theileri]ORC89186.1 hypothetical protein TM35_000131900 [Trypanosoma theileri]